MEELNLEGHREDYINSFMSYTGMLVTTYSLVTKGNICLFLFSCNKKETFNVKLKHSYLILRVLLILLYLNNFQELTTEI